MQKITTGEANILRELTEGEGHFLGKGTLSEYEFSRKPRTATLYNLEEKGLVKTVYFSLHGQKVCIYCLPEVDVPSHYENHKIYNSYREYVMKVHGIDIYK